MRVNLNVVMRWWWCVVLVVVLVAVSVAAEWDPPPLLCGVDKRCRYMSHGRTSSGRYDLHQYSFWLEGKTLSVDFGLVGDGTYLTIHCYGARLLDSSFLPRTESEIIVQEVKLIECPLPTLPLKELLASLNFTFCKTGALSELDCKLVIKDLPSSPPLAAKHFSGFNNLHHLEVSANTPTSPKHGFISPLQNLRKLVLTNVTLPDEELNLAPASLVHIALHDGVERTPEALLSSSAVRQLTITSWRPLDAVAVPANLLDWQVHSPATTLRLDEAPALMTLSLHGWVELHPPPLIHCSALRTLRLTAPAMHALPDGWLTNCVYLEELVIEGALNLTTLQPKLFPKRFGLMRLALRHGALETLPKGLQIFTNLYNLHSLELDGNKLQTIPRGLLEMIDHHPISKVNLSSNDFESSVLMELQRTVRNDWNLLSELDLSHNPRIGDVCEPGHGESPIRFAKNLTKLILTGTGVNKICHDWKWKMPLLETLELSHTNVTELRFYDLLYVRTVRAHVWLLSAPLAAVQMTNEDFTQLERAPPSFTTIHTDAEFECDCRLYWARRALEPSIHALDSISTLRCVGGRLLQETPLEELECGRATECEAAALPAECSCAARPDDDPTRDRLLVHVTCEHAALTRVPQPRTLNDSTPRLYELQLANNQITELHADDLQDNIKGLDLRNNSLTRVSAETAIKLGRVKGLLQLAGNPLECSCSAASLLRALHERTPGATDLLIATCRDGRALYNASTIDCPQSAPLSGTVIAWVAGVLGVLLSLTLATVAFLGSRERRFFILAVLHRWGIVWRTPEPKENENRRYDAFITFSHKDEAVVHELIAELEPTYKLCIHHRDWIPGHFIAEQVVESVRQSRRTIALVSRHFLASSWARAEFREAHTAAMLEARPRLIVVLLEAPEELPLDVQLQRYIKTNTYVRWGDPWFWDKLQLALPPPRATPIQADQKASPH